ncbi:hypothetical protein [Streptomyces sp. LUP30]|uniref:hypothetical protein n=1 Tax=Streptomyces sp. LUP30 TaxID=1890285 RepID=UPI00085162ED|nr:hypothetical protein [Streptomyces sp. LUP30]
MPARFHGPPPGSVTTAGPTPSGAIDSTDNTVLARVVHTGPPGRAPLPLGGVPRTALTWAPKRQLGRRSAARRQ